VTRATAAESACAFVVCGKRRVKHSRSGAFDLNDQVADPQFTTTRLGFRKAPSVE